MPLRSYLNIEKVTPNFAITIYWNSGQFLTNSYSAYIRKLYIKKLRCCKKLGKYAGTNKPRLHATNIKDSRKKKIELN